MKRVLSWLCLVVALAALPQAAFADYSPSTMYILYQLNGGTWTGKIAMSKSSDGNTFTYTLPDAVQSGKQVLFMFASDHIASDKCTSSPDWSYLQGGDWVQYSCGTQSDQHQEDLTNKASGQKLTHQGNVKNVLKITKAGTHTITLTKASSYSSGNQDLTFTYSTGSEPDPTPVTGNFYLSYNYKSVAQNKDMSWAYNIPFVKKSDNLYAAKIPAEKWYNIYFFIHKKETSNQSWDGVKGSLDHFTFTGNSRVLSKDRTQLKSSTSATDCMEYRGETEAGSLYLDFSTGATTPTIYYSNDDDPTPVPGVPEHLYFSFDSDNSGVVWSFNHEFTKEGNKFYYDIDLSKTIYYFITTSNTKSSFNDIKDAANINYSPKTATMDGSDYKVVNNDVLEFKATGPGHCMKSTAGDDSEGFRRVEVDFTDSQNPVIRLYKVGGKPVETFDPSDPRTRKNNLPLKPSDFRNADGSKRAHYFLVGTRMGDWRLQPEWELTSLGNNVVGINTARVMYTGLIGVAMVDNYADYSIGKYTRYNSNDNGGHDFAQNNRSANLYSKGVLEVYNGDSFRELPVGYDYCDRFFAKSSKSFDAAEDGGSQWYTTVKKSTGMVVNSINVTLSNGVPTRLDFDVPSGDAAFDVSNYITFSLVGSEIRNWGMPDAAKSPRGMNSWQDGWVQYDPETGIPYRDAKGNLIYQTCFQPSWLDEHPSYFNMPIGDADNYRDFNYTSQSITMKNAKRFTEKEQSEDPYWAYYNRFNGGNGNLGGSQSVKGTNYDFKEIIDSWDGSSHSDARNANYECFVVKDMWMDGSFKVWTGWGGGLKKNEQSNASGDDAGNARWYYVNGGHGQGGNKHDVEGFDINCGGKDVKVYGTYQDVDGADFNIDKLTYFKRVIVWYDPAKKFNGASAVQLIREMFGPQIKAFRGEYGHQIDREWNISALGLDSQDFEKTVKEYTVDLYRYNATSKEFEFVKTVQHENRNGMTVKDFTAYQFGQEMTGDEHVIAGTDSQLSAGTYRYKVTVKIDDNGEDKERDAWSNHVTLYEASQPVNAEAYQRTETKNGKTLYSFDVVLDLDLKDGQIIDGDTEYTYNKLVSHYLVEVPDGTAATMNSALEVTMDGTKVEKPANGWFQNKSVDVYVDGKTTAESKLGYWLEIPVDENNPAKQLVFHNLIGATPQQVYNFDIYLRPRQNVETVYAQANFEHSHVQTTMTIPGVEVKFVAGGVKPYTDNKPEEMLFGKKTPAKAMPMGSHDKKQSDVNAAENFQVVAPIHYTEANQLYAEFSVTEPAVTNSVRDNFTIRYRGASVQTDRDKLLNLGESKPYEVELTAEEAFAGITKRECIDVTNLAHEATEIDADGNTYLTVATGAVVPVLAIADVEYQFENNANVIKPINYSRVDNNLSLDLPVPSVEPQVRLTTNEQNATDNKRYYVHELFANLALDNISTVQANYTVCPGFHLVPAQAHGVEFANDFGTTDHKSARGGIIAHEGLFGYTNDFFQSTYLEGYTPFNGIYDQASDNWARLSANKANIPVYVNYFWVQDKENTADYRADIPALSGYVAYHYPFVVKDNSTVVALADNADEEHNMVTLTAVAPLNKAFKADEVMTAIEDVTADGDRADAEFFNLQGIRVMNPVPGQVYLVRRGADVTKVLYK